MPTMLAPTQRPHAVAVAISRLNGLAIDYGKLHNAFDREHFRDLCRKLYEVLKPILVCGIPDYSVDSAIRDHFQEFFGWDGVKNGELSINTNYLLDDMQADAVLSLIGYNKFQDHIDVHPDGSSTVYQKEVLKPGAIADSTLGLFLPEYWRYDGSSIGNVAPRKYAEFCTSLVAILEQAGEVKTTPSTDASEQLNALKTKGGKVNDDSLPPVADNLEWLRSLTSHQREALHRMATTEDKPGDIDSEFASRQSKAKYKGKEYEPRKWKQRDSYRLLGSARDRGIVTRRENGKNTREFTDPAYIEATKANSENSGT